MLLSSAGDVIRYPECAHDFINFSVSRVFEMSNVFAALRLIFFLLLWQQEKLVFNDTGVKAPLHPAVNGLGEHTAGCHRSGVFRITQRLCNLPAQQLVGKTCSQKVPISKLYNVKVSIGRKTICFSNIKQSTMLCKQCKFFSFFPLTRG